MTSESKISILHTSTTPTCLCLGSGRFLRSVLVPFLSHDSNVAIFQTRGRSFLDFLNAPLGDENKNLIDSNDAESLKYPVDTVNYNGEITTDHIRICAAGTLGSNSGKDELKKLIQNSHLQVISVGVTEAGLSSAGNQCMIDLTWVLYELYSTNCMNFSDDSKKLCIINTDNVPNNGDVIREHVFTNANQLFRNEVQRKDMSFVDYIENKVAFLNSMVDRITSARTGSGGMVPSCEPLPNKALVICDPENHLPNWMAMTDVQKRYGVKIRRHPNELACDISLKLRVANGTHTALAHVMALSAQPNTETLSATPYFLKYLDSLFETQILPAAISDGISQKETVDTWQDWRKRVQHPYFGLSTFFITQNVAAKSGIRLGPSVKALIGSAVGSDKAENPLSVSMAYAFAAILRLLSPHGKQSLEGQQRRVYVGWLDGDEDEINPDTQNSEDNVVQYADGLRFNLTSKWYEFRCACSVEWSSVDVKRDVLLPCALSMIGRGRQPHAYSNVIRSYLLNAQGGDLKSVLEGESVEEEYARAVIFETFVAAVSTLYARMASGDSVIGILNEIVERQHVYSNGLASSCEVLVDGPLPGQYVVEQPIHFRRCPIPDSSHLMSASKGVKVEDIASVILSEVQGQSVIDLHTHLLPPSHGSLCLWGIDELLTYHYLVAEYFMTAPGKITPERFYAMSKAKQADIIWEALFVTRSPISEATRGVLTTLKALGLEDHIKSRNLDAIRKFYDEYRNNGLNGSESFTALAHKISGVRYVIMTNVPFDPNESQHWRPKKKQYKNTFKSALRIDPLLAGDKKTIETALKASGYGLTLADARTYLHDWCDTIDPEYLMASTPHDFYVPPSVGGSLLASVKKTGVNEASLQAPFAFVDATGDDCTGCDDADDIPSIINEDSDFLVDVLMRVCEERNLPLALKIGAHRSVNPNLLEAGDGMVAFADTASLARLCIKFPKVKFLATFLSRANQHEACVLASKFGNLHIYGCWWYCNNPSIIDEITRMRIEMLGTSFTAQHSDARVIDQLIYKWSHSRAVIANVIAKEYVKTAKSGGWHFSRKEMRRDVWRLFGGSYEEFMEKTLN